jgi:hypothetical protein
MITSGSPKEPKNEQQAAGHSQSSRSIRSCRLPMPRRYRHGDPDNVIAFAIVCCCARWWRARVTRKKLRMPFIAGNGLVIQIPALLYLATLASRGEVGSLFDSIQTVELVADAVNLTLMSLNIRDGFRLTGRLR